MSIKYDITVLLSLVFFLNDVCDKLDEVELSFFFDFLTRRDEEIGVYFFVLILVRDPDLGKIENKWL